ncbi:GNVR domain-containing protein [Paracoccus beibuensis]|uniref:GNVR domain-containing protein n=1 Tax=Paracoccus beibuensis TaxID=547602 RepID=UPI00223FCC2B|nr:GNVR domain-containing protein [Paracoccus beibuensis]
MTRELRPYLQPVSPDASPPPPTQTIELRWMMAALRRQKTTILLPAVLLGALGLVYALAKPETYSASATLLLDGTMNNSIRQVGGIDGRAMPEETIENARVVMSSDKLAHDVLEITGLAEDPAFLSPPTSPVTTGIDRFLGTLFLPVNRIKDKVTMLISPAAPEPEPEDDVAPQAQDATAERVDPRTRRATWMLQRGITIARVGRSSAVSVDYVSHDPVYAAAVANAYADAYAQDILTSNANAVGQTSAWMLDRLKELRAQAQAAADAAEQFATENQLAMSSTGVLLGEQAQGELNASLTEAISERARAQALLDIFDQAVTGGVEGLRAGSSLSIGGPVSDSLRTRLDNYNNITARLQQLVESSGPDHPQVAGLRETLNSAAERLFIELQARRQEARTELAVAEERVNALGRSLDEVTETNAGQAAALVRLRSLQQEAETLSTLYQTTLTRSQEFEQQQSFPVSNVRVLSHAQVPNIPSGPATTRTAIAAGLLGLFFGLARAALREARDRSMRTANDVTDRSGLPFLGHLPMLGRSHRAVPPLLRLTKSASTASGSTLPAVTRPEIPPVPIPVLAHPDSLYSETLRHIRLAASGRSSSLPVIGMTSFHRYEDRSTVTLNLAGQTAASSGRRVLLIDTDRRDRQLSHIVGLDEKRGLGDLAADPGDWRSLLWDVKHSHLTVLPAGLASSEACDDLAVARTLRMILDQIGDEFGCVVLDVPPLYPGAQGLAILQELPGFVIVAEWGKTPRDMVETVLTNHPQLEAYCLGVVYDRMVPRRLKSFLVPGSVETILVSPSGTGR